jgi:endonuclease YncB( thermonuclease family)
MTKNKKKGISNKIKIGVAAGAVATAGMIYVIFGSGKPVPVFPTYAARIIDGDTFITREDQRIKLASTDAPELERCGGPEAKQALEKFILGKPLYLKTYYQDPYHRLVASVTTKDGLVNAMMTEKGYSYYYGGQPEVGTLIQQAGEKARQKKIGVFSDKCTQWENREHPNCQIKGNDRNGKIYYIKGCRIYDTVSVQLYLGDKWFCTETQAVKEGFRKGIQCP